MFALSVLAALGHLSQRERQGTGDADSHAQSADWARNDRIRTKCGCGRRVFGWTESSGPTEEYMRCGGVTAGREVRGSERCFEQVLRCFFVRCAKFGGETQNGVDIGVGECHN